MPAANLPKSLLWIIDILWSCCRWVLNIPCLGLCLLLHRLLTIELLVILLIVLKYKQNTKNSSVNNIVLITTQKKESRTGFWYAQPGWKRQRPTHYYQNQNFQHQCKGSFIVQLRDKQSDDNFNFIYKCQSEDIPEGILSWSDRQQRFMVKNGSRVYQHLRHKEKKLGMDWSYTKAGLEEQHATRWIGTRKAHANVVVLKFRGTEVSRKT